jgi:hypothetical protein
LCELGIYIKITRMKAKTIAWQAVHTLMTQNRVSRADLQKALNISSNNVTNWKARGVPVSWISALSKFFGVDPSYFLQLAQLHDATTSSDGENTEVQTRPSDLYFAGSNNRVFVMFTCLFRAGEWIKPERYIKTPKKFLEYPKNFGTDAFVVVHIGDGMGFVYLNEQPLIVDRTAVSPRGHCILQNKRGGWRLAVYMGPSDFGPHYLDRESGKPIVVDDDIEVLNIRAVLSPDQIRNEV